MERPHSYRNLATFILSSCFWLTYPFCFLSSCEASMKPGNTTDLEALIAFKACISNDSLGALSSWNETNTTLHFCSWPGVACTAARHPGRITTLNLGSFGLTGTISPHLGNISFLRELNLSDNNLYGPIPSLAHCSRLRRISLGKNNLVGQIPANFSNCLDLRAIYLGYNQLTGTVPASLSSLPMLSALGVQGNQLIGSISISFGNATSLTAFDMSENNLVGCIPEELGKLSNLETLSLDSNRLSGDIPSALFNISSLVYFSVISNNFSGTLPHNMFRALPNLAAFGVHDNQLSGLVPGSLSNASALQQVGFARNKFVGPVPENLGSLRYLRILEIGENQMEAKEDFLISLSNCTNLNVLVLSRNNFRLLRPTSVANLSTELEVLLMGDNQISGSVPSSINRFKKLIVFGMAGNSLTGNIPSAIAMLQNLHSLALSRNQLSGEIPSSIGNLTQLNDLWLSENELQGSIPSIIGNIPLLDVLDLSYNKLVGNIPGQAISKLSSLSKYFNLSHNSLTGPLPSQIGSLINLNILDVSANQLSGDIPSSLGGCLLLGQLFLQDNLFQGTIPSTLTALKGIQVLDLSNNNLSGTIPGFLLGFHLLNYLNLSFNHFEGQVPKGGAFGNASAISVLGNDRLCGGIQQLHLPPCDSHGGSRNVHASPPLEIIIPAIVASVLLILLSAAYYIRKQRTKKTSTLVPSLNEPFVQISYDEIHKATDGFSSSNLLGAGSFGLVYKGIMDSNTNQVVAIKVLKLDQRGAYKSFIAECDSLRAIRHRNLINVLTVCSSIDHNGDDFKALIYEYMANGNLDEWLHPDREADHANSKKLSLVQRLNIVMDMAFALDYLHHQCETPIVHCDLKPTNVLLDHNMDAHVGDFGLSRFLHRTISSSQDTTDTVGIKGSIGYIAPEYGMGGPVTIQGDVYSYGVVLLETFTGKRPTDDIFQSDLDLYKYVDMAYKDRVLDIVDPSIFLNGDEPDDSNANNNTCTGDCLQECMTSIFRIGLSCSKQSLNDRMDIRDVIKGLTLVKKLVVKGIHAEPTISNVT